MASLEDRDRRERESRIGREQRLRQVTPEVGRFLHALVLASRSRVIVEIGTSGGYSTLWLASAARLTGGTVITLEIDPVKVELAQGSTTDAGLSEAVTIVQGDAFAYLYGCNPETLDFCFLDAEKEDYPAFYDLAVPLLREGGVLVADNILSHEEELRAFTAQALSDPRMSAVVVPIGRGELLSVRSG
jgi:predicted O-methyltransferase YrrM